MNNYIEFYSKWMDSRVITDYKTAGGTLYEWEESGKRQLNFLKSQGFLNDTAKSNILEIGFGTFSLGFNIIKTLNDDFNLGVFRYVGMDISQESLNFARNLLYNDNRSAPVLHKNKDFLFENEFSEGYYRDVGFDYIWAFSVFNHLPFEHFEEFIDNVGKIINNKTIILLTIWSDNDKTRPHHINNAVGKVTSFWYNMDDVERKCNSTGYNIELVDSKTHIVFNTDWIKIIKITRMIK